MGRLKDHYWDEICERVGGHPISEEDLEMLDIDAQQAADRYRAAVEKKRGQNEPR